MKKILNYLNLALIALFLAVSVFSCKKEISGDSGPSENPVNDTKQVTASISGVVVNENNIPLMGVTVQSGSVTTKTNQFGMFSFNNISVSEENATVKVFRPGYFNAFKTFKAKSGKNRYVKIKLLPKTLAGTFGASSGGTINVTGGATIVFPANSIVTSSGSPYNGQVKVFATWIDPTGNNLYAETPGDLRGITTNGVERILTTYGMVGAELMDASGNSLKIAPNQTAQINFPIPASLQSSAPATIPLWHFDEATARWKEEGTATKNGNSYQGAVKHFSFWNCDVPSNFVRIDFTLLNAGNNSPLANTQVRIKRVSNNTYGSDYTDGNGYIFGWVPKNEALVLEVMSPCNTVVYSQNIGPFSSNASLGNILVTPASVNTITITGNVTNCSNAAVTNGGVYIYAGVNYPLYVPLSSSGAFSATILNCSGGTLNLVLTPFDNSAGQQGSGVSLSASSGSVSAGTIQACGTSTAQYMNGTIDGVPFSYINPPDSVLCFQTVPQPSVSGFSNIVYVSARTISGISGTSNGFELGILNNNNTTNGQLNYLSYFNFATNTQSQLIAGSASPVVFTAFGSVPFSFVEGSFTCQITSPTGPKNVTCSFRARRNT